MLSIDECKELSMACFPACLKTNADYEKIIQLLAYALHESYKQYDILKYAYYPDLVDAALLPKIADTLKFDYPLGYPLDQLRTIIKYLVKVRKNRGTIFSMQSMIRLLNITIEDIYYKTYAQFSDVEIREYAKGIIQIRYDGIVDYDFAYSAMRMVVPAGYHFILETTDKGNFRHRMEWDIKYDEKVSIEFGLKDKVELLHKFWFPYKEDFKIDRIEIEDRLIILKKDAIKALDSDSIYDGLKFLLKLNMPAYASTDPFQEAVTDQPETGRSVFDYNVEGVYAHWVENPTAYYFEDFINGNVEKAYYDPQFNMDKYKDVPNLASRFISGALVDTQKGALIISSTGVPVYPVIKKAFAEGAYLEEPKSPLIQTVLGNFELGIPRQISKEYKGTFASVKFKESGAKVGLCVYQYDNVSIFTSDEWEYLINDKFVISEAIHKLKDLIIKLMDNLDAVNEILVASGYNPIVSNPV